MALYKGVVREIYEYEIDIEAECPTDAVKKLKEIYNDNNNEGIFVADALSFLKAEYAVEDTEKGRVENGLL